MKLLKETEKPYFPSGHAFVVVDSIETAVAIMENFKAGPKHYFWYFCDYIKKLCCCCCRGDDVQSRPHSRSNFNFFEEMPLEALEQIYKDNILIMERAVEPTEIIWKNMCGNKGLFIMKRTFFMLLGVVIILFGTTPLVILTRLEYFMEVLQLQKLATARESYIFVVTYFQPMLVLGTNLLLLLLIDISSVKECFETHSQY